MKNMHFITKDFEHALCEYTGAPFAVALDSCTSALLLCLHYIGIENQTITIPNRTYMSVPCAIIQAGGRVNFRDIGSEYLEGAYQLEPTPVWDSALRFTSNMYVSGQYQCLSFTGPHKRLKLGKGGAILHDNPDADEWFRRAKMSGRREISYHDDAFDMLGWNYWMLPQLAAQGLHMMPQFYDINGTPVDAPDLRLKYPDLSKHKIYTQ